MKSFFWGCYRHSHSWFMIILWAASNFSFRHIIMINWIIHILHWIIVILIYWPIHILCCIMIKWTVSSKCWNIWSLEFLEIYIFISLILLPNFFIKYIDWLSSLISILSLPVSHFFLTYIFIFRIVLEFLPNSKILGSLIV